jgi:putative ABC transport system ATP-binding protein
MALISLQNVSKAYGANSVLRSIDLEIQDGEFISIIGSSGSGKSTLLNIIGALDTSYDGRAYINGKEVRDLNDKQVSKFRNETLGYVFQSFHLLNHLNVAQNVALPAQFNPQRSSSEIDDLVNISLKRVGLGHKRDESPLHLSGGERQRVAIARALFNQPKIILCDEPTGALDSQTGEQILSLFERLNRETGVTLIIVTHDSTVSKRADRIVEIKDGAIISSGAVSAPISELQ